MTGTSDKPNIDADRLHRSPGAGPGLARERTDYAQDRTVLANERTYGAWVRTGFTAMAAGLAAAKLLGDMLPRWSLLTISTVSITYGAFAFVAAVWRYRHSHRAHRDSDTPHIPLAIVVTANVMLLAAAVAALAGLLLVW